MNQQLWCVCRVMFKRVKLLLVCPPAACVYVCLCKGLWEAKCTASSPVTNSYGWYPRLENCMHPGNVTQLTQLCRSRDIHVRKHVHVWAPQWTDPTSTPLSTAGRTDPTATHHPQSFFPACILAVVWQANHTTCSIWCLHHHTPHTLQWQGKQRHWVRADVQTDSAHACVGLVKEQV